MKSLGKLKKFALHHKSDAKEKVDHQLLVQLEGLAHAFQDMQDMRSCYDSLLSAAAVTTNCAFEFSESLLEMGNCLLDKTGLSADGESGRVLSMLGKVQLELQNLMDSYRSHVILTITKPSESLLSELRKVEEMKLQCEDKREIYEYMMAQSKEKGRSRSGKGDTFTPEQLHNAREEYYEAARLCVFRVQSLKQGLSHSILAQASRHHAAQLNFFRKGLKSLETVEPEIRLVAEKERIDYQFNALDDVENEDNYEKNDQGELSFDYRKNKQGIENMTSRNSMEVEASYPQSLRPDDLEAAINKNQGEEVFCQLPRAGSHSAPIYTGKRNIVEKIREMQPSIRNLHTHVLPTPFDAKSSSLKASPISHSSSLIPRKSAPNIWHSSPLDSQKHEKDLDDNPSSNAARSKGAFVPEGSASFKLPLPSTEGLSLPQCDTHNANDSANSKRQAFSDPLSSKPWSTKPVVSSSAPITSESVVTGLISSFPNPRIFTYPNASQGTSPPLVSSPKISELHELPRPPGGIASKQASAGVLGHSAPLVSGNRDLSPTNRSPSRVTNAASPLPLPPLTVTRSFSIPSRSQRGMALHMARLLESPSIPEKAEDVTSPPLTPISLSNVK